MMMMMERTMRSKGDFPPHQGLLCHTKRQYRPASHNVLSLNWCVRAMEGVCASAVSSRSDCSSSRTRSNNDSRGKLKLLNRLWVLQEEVQQCVGKLGVEGKLRVGDLPPKLRLKYCEMKGLQKYLSEQTVQKARRPPKKVTMTTVESKNLYAAYGDLPARGQSPLKPVSVGVAIALGSDETLVKEAFSGTKAKIWCPKDEQRRVRKMEGQPYLLHRMSPSGKSHQGQDYVSEKEQNPWFERTGSMMTQTHMSRPCGYRWTCVIGGESV